MRPDSALATGVLPSPNYGDRRGRTIDAIVLHYTGMATGAAALARLCDAAAEVSCHYLVWEDGHIDQLVAERDRAWHAGRSIWAGETDINSVSIGIEIVNAGHDGGCPPYPDTQIDALVALLDDLWRRHAIDPARILAHSDIAPQRKEDPGEWFPWKRLGGLSLYVTPSPVVAGSILSFGENGAAVSALQAALGTIGYDSPISGTYCAATRAAVVSFQRRHRPALIDGKADLSTLSTLDALLHTISAPYPKRRLIPRQDEP